MVRRKSSSGVTKQELFQKKLWHQGNTSENEDLYFAMDFPPTSESGDQAVCSKSCESYRIHAPDFKEIPYTNASNRELSRGPERPKTLRIQGVTKQPNGDIKACSQSPTRARHWRIPKMSMSHPKITSDLWKKDMINVEHSKSKTRQLSLSDSSMEGYKNDAFSQVYMANSRYSLGHFHYDSGKRRSTPDLQGLTPRSIPSFLRTSLSKLISMKVKTPDLTSVPRSLPSFASFLPSSRSVSRATSPQWMDDKMMEENVSKDSSPPSTPATKSFVEESLAKGLPIIPFNYPSSAIVETRRKKSSKIWKTMRLEDYILDNISDFSNEKCCLSEIDSIQDKANQVTLCAQTSREDCSMECHKEKKEDFDEIIIHGELRNPQEVEEKSLQTVLTQAKLQMKQEDILKSPKLKKLSWIRGYAANNSRALERRRSSMTGYVQAMQQVCCKGIGKRTNQQGLTKSNCNNCTTPSPTKESQEPSEIEENNFKFHQNNLAYDEQNKKENDTLKAISTLEDPGYIDMHFGRPV